MNWDGMKKTLCFLVLSTVLVLTRGNAQETEGVTVNWDVLEAVGAKTSTLVHKKAPSGGEDKKSSLKKKEVVQTPTETAENKEPAKLTGTLSDETDIQTKTPQKDLTVQNAENAEKTATDTENNNENKKTTAAKSQADGKDGVLKNSSSMAAYPAGRVSERKIRPLSDEKDTWSIQKENTAKEESSVTKKEVSFEPEILPVSSFLKHKDATEKPDLCQGIEGCLGVMLFQANSSDIQSAAEIELEKVFRLMQQQEEIKLRLQAHASGTDENRNQARRLSLSRALAARSWLVDRGIHSTRIEVRPIGHKQGGLYPDRVELIRLER
jgi:outer membrane protein OmpA-like peptidoglycan-associated protein